MATFLFTCSICTSKLRVKPANVSVRSDTIITVSPVATTKSSMYHVLQQLKEQLRHIVIKVSRRIHGNPLTRNFKSHYKILVLIQGLPTICRARITIDDAISPPQYKLFVEGDNMREVMGTYGIKWQSTRSNNVYEMWKTLGIEAAR